MRVCSVDLRIVWAILLPAVLALSACGSDPAALFESAKQREAKGDRVGAIIDLKSAIQKDPENAAMRFMLGRLYNETFDEAGAEKELRKARDLGLVEGGRVNVELARALRVQGKFKELVNDVQPAAAFEQEQLAIVHALRGRAQDSLGDAEGAKQSLEAARRAAPNNPDVRLFEAQLLAGEKDVKGALAIVDELAERVPNRADVWIYKAGLHQRQGRTKEVLDAYDKILELHPTHFRTLLSRSSYFIGLGRLDAAQKDIDVLQKKYKGHPLVLVQQGQLRLAQNRPKDAAESAQLALKIDPKLVGAQLVLGMALHKQGTLQQAEQVLTKLVAAHPRELLGRAVLADVLVQLGQATKALDVLAPVLAAGLADARIFAVAADANVRLGNFRAAYDWYQKATAAKPDDPDLQLRQALALIAGGRTDMAIPSLEKAMSSGKGSVSANEILITALLARGDVAKALAAIDQLEKSGNPAIASNFRGSALLVKGDKEGARQAFESALKRQPGLFAAAHNLVRLDLQSGNIDAARKRYADVLKADPKNLEAMLAAAELELRLGNGTGAREAYERAVSAHPSALQPKAQLARFLVAEGDLQRAKTVADEVLAAHPGDPYAMILVAEIQLLAGNPNSAVQSLTALTRAFPKSDDAYLRLGNAQRAAKRDREAEVAYRKALELQPGSAPVQVALASLLMKGNRDAEALQLARRIQATYPKTPIGLLIEGELLEGRGKHAEAAALFRKALKVRNESEIAARVFRARSAAGDVQGALGELQEYAKAHPGDLDVLAVLAHAHLERGDYTAAIRHYEAIIAQDATNVYALNSLAWAYQKTRDKRARATAEAAFKLNPSSPVVADTLGWILVNEGEVAKGLGYIKQAAAALPKHPEIRFHLGAALIKSGDRAAGRKELSDALALDKGFAQAKEAQAMLDSLN